MIVGEIKDLSQFIAKKAERLREAYLEQHKVNQTFAEAERRHYMDKSISATETEPS